MPHRVLVNVSSRDWSVHFISPDGQTRIGPWLLHDTHDEVLKILEWCCITDEDLAECNSERVVISLSHTARNGVIPSPPAEISAIPAVSPGCLLSFKPFHNFLVFLSSIYNRRAPAGN